MKNKSCIVIKAVCHV
uniref:Uncharacterized protein n=1 Tax=Anguilla anguilla TaxID=7936 RepID=A0A0E9TZF8_ANGAN